MSFSSEPGAVARASSSKYEKPERFCSVSEVVFLDHFEERVVIGVEL
jgi:hypothetical protein